MFEKNMGNLLPYISPSGWKNTKFIPRVWLIFSCGAYKYQHFPLNGVKIVSMGLPRLQFHLPDFTNANASMRNVKIFHAGLMNLSTKWSKQTSPPFRSSYGCAQGCEFSGNFLSLGNFRKFSEISESCRKFKEISENLQCFPIILHSQNLKNLRFSLKC